MRQPFRRRSREGGNPGFGAWTPAYAGVTTLLLAIVGFQSSACRGSHPGSGPPTPTPTPPIQIAGTLLVAPPGIGTPYVSVRVQFAGSVPTPISWATVTVNGTAVPWVPTATVYEMAYSGPTPANAAVTLAVQIPGLYYGSSTTTLPPTVPAIQSPASLSTWGVATPIPVVWTLPGTGVQYQAIDGSNSQKCAAIYRGLTAPIAVLGPEESSTELRPYTFCVPTPAPGVTPVPALAYLYIAAANGSGIPGAGQADPFGKLLNIREQWVAINLGPNAVRTIWLTP